jgi:hypothetical protein
MVLRRNRLEIVSITLPQTPAHNAEQQRARDQRALLAQEREVRRRERRHDADHESWRDDGDPAEEEEGQELRGEIAGARQRPREIEQVRAEASIVGDQAGAEPRDHEQREHAHREVEQRDLLAHLDHLLREPGCDHARRRRPAER